MDQFSYVGRQVVGDKSLGWFVFSTNRPRRGPYRWKWVATYVNWRMNMKHPGLFKLGVWLSFCAILAVILYQPAANYLSSARRQGATTPPIVAVSDTNGMAVKKTDRIQPSEK